MNNGEIIRISIPALTEEEDTSLLNRLGMRRNSQDKHTECRKWANDELKQLLKNGLPEDVEKMLLKMFSNNR